MRTKFRHALWLAVLLILPLALTGCYRSIGGRMEPTPSSGVALVSQQSTPLPQPTFTPMEVEPTLELASQEPTLTPFPTLAPPSDTPQPTLTWTRIPVDGQGGMAVTDTPVIVAIAPSFTPRPASTSTPVPTLAPTMTPQPTNTNTAVPSNTPLAVAVIPTFPPTNTQPAVVLPTATFTSVPYRTLPPSPTYTPFMPPAPVLSGQGGQAEIAVLPTFTPSGGGEAVPLGERPTDTQAAPIEVAQVPTLTPPPQDIAQVPTLSEFQITATSIVFNATATAAALMGIQLPTFTPIPGQVGFATPLPPNVIVITATPLGQAGICGQYVIQVNDTLYRIAARYGVSVQQIAQANNITNPDLIKMGATLQIPCPVAATATPIVAQPVQQTGQGGFAASNVYVVQSGDNIYQISLRFGVTMSELMAANGMDSTTSQMIYVGQELVIPASANLPTATPAPGQIVATPIYIIVTNTPGFSG